MILDLIINALLSPILLLLDSLPTLSLGNVADFSVLFNYITIISAVVPIKQLLPILLIKFAISSFGIIWAIVLRIKSFIPTMGA